MRNRHSLRVNFNVLPQRAQTQQRSVAIFPRSIILQSDCVGRKERKQRAPDRDRLVSRERKLRRQRLCCRCYARNFEITGHGV